MENRIAEFFEGLEHYAVIVYSFRHGINPQVAQYRVFENCSANELNDYLHYEEENMNDAYNINLKYDIQENMLSIVVTVP